MANKTTSTLREDFRWFHEMATVPLKVDERRRQEIEDEIERLIATLPLVRDRQEYHKRQLEVLKEILRSAVGYLDEILAGTPPVSKKRRRR